MFLVKLYIYHFNKKWSSEVKGKTEKKAGWLVNHNIVLKYQKDGHRCGKKIFITKSIVKLKWWIILNVKFIL